MLRVGLTGGICAGKTTVAELFRSLEVPIVDADELAHELVEAGQPALQAITQRFGASVLHADGSLDRKKLRERVFADSAERTALERILHPAIRAATETRMRGFELAAAPYAINVVPLLIETGLQKTFDRILVVDVPEDVQLARLVQRDDIDAVQAERMLQAQASRKERLAAAHDIIRNDRARTDLEADVRRLHACYLRLARTGSRPQEL